jgi:hypothetical protein
VTIGAEKDLQKSPRNRWPHGKYKWRNYSVDWESSYLGYFGFRWRSIEANTFGANGFGDNAPGNSIALDPADNVIVAGQFSDSIDFGGGLLSSAGQRDLSSRSWTPLETHLG